MKKLMLMLAVFVTASAHATKARLVALNQDTNGSYFIMDTRNIFLNPAQLSIMKDHLNFEWGKKDRPGMTTEVPENEGGFVMSLGGGKLAAQLGRVNDFDGLVREMNQNLSDVGTAVKGGNFGEGQNNVDVIYGGNAGADLHWGAGLSISRSKTSIDTADHQTSVQAYEARGGIHADRWEAFGGLILGGESKTDLGPGVDGKLSESFGLRAGGGFQVSSEFRLFASGAYDHYNATQANNGPDYDGKRLSLGAGAVYLRSLEENARLFASAEVKYLDNKAGGNKGLDDEKYNSIDLPLTLGIEADANTWARVRASVRQGILLGQTKTTVGTTKSDNKWENSPNSTSVAAGAGASANRFNFDVALAQALVDDGAHVEVAMTYIF